MASLTDRLIEPFLRSGGVEYFYHPSRFFDQEREFGFQNSSTVKLVRHPMILGRVHTLVNTLAS